MADVDTLEEAKRRIKAWQDKGDFEAALNLSELMLSEIPEKIKDLTALTKLDLGGNKISDISHLSGLTTLTWLSLSGNQISDISHLSGLTALTTLSLRSNKISDISHLAWLKDMAKKASNDKIGLLEGIDFDDNPLADPNLRDIAKIEDNNERAREAINHIRVSQGLSDFNTWIKELEHGEGQMPEGWEPIPYPYEGVTPWSPPEENEEARRRIKEWQEIGDVKAELDLSWLKLTEIPEEITTCLGLKELNLSDNCLVDITSLSALPSVIRLHLGGNQLRDITALKKLTALNELYLYDNQIQKFPQFSCFKNLTYLDLQNNQISDVSHLAWLGNMAQKAYKNELRNLDGILFDHNPLRDPKLLEIAEIKDTNKRTREAINHIRVSQGLSDFNTWIKELERGEGQMPEGWEPIPYPYEGVTPWSPPEENEEADETAAPKTDSITINQRITFQRQAVEEAIDHMSLRLEKLEGVKHNDPDVSKELRIYQTLKPLAEAILEDEDTDEPPDENPLYDTKIVQFLLNLVDLLEKEKGLVKGTKIVGLVSIVLVAPPVAASLAGALLSLDLASDKSIKRLRKLAKPLGKMLPKNWIGRD